VLLIGLRPLGVGRLYLSMPGEDRMDNHREKLSLEYKWPRSLSAGLLIVKGFISRLVSLFTVTQQDLIDAGIDHTPTRD
jgi:hypothetical protein